MSAPTPDRRQALASLGGAAALLALTPRIARAADAALSTLPEADYTEQAPMADVMAAEDSSRRMTAPVMVDGRGPFDFVVDTGTNRTVLSNELAASLELAAGPTAIVHGIGGVVTARTVKIDSLKIGEREARRLHLPSMPAKMLGGAGLLGVDGLKNQRVVLDFLQVRLQIEPSSKRWAGAESSVVAATRRFGQLTMVDTDLDGRQVAVIVDTGSEATIGNSQLRSMMVRNSRDESRLSEVELIGATGQMALGQFGGVPLFRLGKLTIGNLRVVYSDLHTFELWGLHKRPAMILGMDVLRHFDGVAIDFGKSEVRFVIPKDTRIDPAGDSRWPSRFRG
ncbi:MAG: aspartyl protease family protein [Caulobacteraceae bacterium]